MRDLNLLTEAGEPRISWVQKLRVETKNAALRAVTSHALSAAGRLSVKEIIEEAERSSRALLHIYTKAVSENTKAVSELSLDTEDRKAVKSWAGTSVLHKQLLSAVI